MPALSSFIYKPGRKNKGAIKAPFLRRGPVEQSTALASPVPQPLPPQKYLTSEVIDIGDQSTRYSLDFDGGKPIDESENDLIDEEPRFPRPDTTLSPRVQLQLDIELSPEEDLTDWFRTNFPQTGAQGPEQSKASGSGLRNEVLIEASNANGYRNGNSNGESVEDDDASYATSSEDVLETLQTMNVSIKLHIQRPDDLNSPSSPLTLVNCLDMKTSTVWYVNCSLLINFFKFNYI